MIRLLARAATTLTLISAFGAHASEQEAASNSIASAAGSVEVSADGSVGSPDSLVPPADRRGAEQTLLTYPEWLLVHSPSEYARMMQSEPSHEFPFVAHIGELWSSYAIVTREQLRAGYPINPGYHMMIGVIATSTTVEYGVRAVYGNTVGRISWALGGARATDEDRYDAQTAQQYVDFIRQEPWYLFNFGSRLKGLWTEVPTAGPGMIRKWERRFALTGEYGVKALYAQAIKVATHAAYAPPQMTTDVVVDRLPDDWTPPAEVKLVKRFDDGRALLSLPRYYDFRIAATALARQGLHIIDIAGNQSTILVSLWAPEGKAVEVDGARTLFTQPIRTPAHTTRVVMLVPVPKLTELLAGADDAGWTVEHVYDY